GGRGDLAAFGLAPDLGDQLGGAVDARLDAGVAGRLAGEAFLLADGDVVGEDDAVRRLDHRRVEPGEAGGALGLDGDLHACLAPGVLQGLGGHVGVGDAGGAGGDGDDPEGARAGAVGAGVGARSGSGRVGGVGAALGALGVVGVLGVLG